MEKAQLPAFSAAEVAKHNSEEDCWVIVAGRVYDVTAYLPKHPGGKALISRSAGQDVTRDFEAMFHSVRARDRLQQLLVGELAGVATPVFLSPFAAGAAGSRPGPGAGRGPYGLGAAAAVKLPARLGPTSWATLTIVGRREEAGGCRVLRVGLPQRGSLGLKPSQHVRVRRGGVARSYTPTEWRTDGWFELTVKEYPAPGGEMSRHLCSLVPGNEIEVCGPCGDFVWEKVRQESAVGEVLLVGIGTGVTPLAQVLRGIQESDWARGKKLRARLVMGWKSAEHVMLASTLRELVALAGGLLEVRHVFSSKGERVTPESVATEMSTADWTLACGTDEFVAGMRQMHQEKGVTGKFHAF